MLILHDDTRVLDIVKQGEMRGSDLWQCGRKRGPINCSATEVPDQDLSRLRTKEGIAGRWPDDVVQYTPEELARTPSAALAALKLRGTATSESTPGLSERVGLIERILGTEVE